MRWTTDDGAEIVARLYRPFDRRARRRRRSLLGARWTDGSVEHRVPRPVRLLDRPGLGRAGARPPGLDGQGACSAGAPRPVGRPRRRGLRRGACASPAEWMGRPRRLVIMGGRPVGSPCSTCSAPHPDLCAAGVDLFGVADLFDLDETTHRFEAHYLHTIVGPLPEAADRYRDAVAGQPGRADHGAAPHPPGRRRQGRAAGAERGDPPEAARSGAPSSCRCTRARATGGVAPRPSSTSSSERSPFSAVTSYGGEHERAKRAP